MTSSVCTYALPTAYEGVEMTGVTKTIRLSGGSSHSIEDAISTVLGRAALTIADIEKFEVVELGGTVADSGLPEAYQVTLDITFGVRESVHG